MNIVQMQDNLKDLSDRQLLGTMQTGTVPEYLVIAELQRRKKARQDAAPQQQRQPQSTVAEELMGGIAAAPAPNMQRFSAGGVVPFNQGGSTRDQMLAELRRSLTVMAVPASQKAQILSNAEMLPEAALPGYVSSVTSAGMPEPRADVAMPSTPSLFPEQGYTAESRANREELQQIPAMMKDATLSSLRALESAPETISGAAESMLQSASEPAYSAAQARAAAGEKMAEMVGDYYGPDHPIHDFTGEIKKTAQAAKDLDLTAEGLAGLVERAGQLKLEDMPVSGMFARGFDKYVRDWAAPQAASQLAYGSRFVRSLAGEEGTEGSYTPAPVGSLPDTAPSWMGDFAPPPRTAETRISERTGEGVGLPPMPEAPTTPSAPETPEVSPLPSPAAPTQDEILRVGRADDSATSTAPQVGTEQLAGMGETELAQTREVAKERPDFFSPEALLALGIGMIAGGSKPGSTFGSAVGEGGLAMLKQVQSQREAEAEREEAEMLEAGRMERARMEQAGLTRRAGINADLYARQFAALNRQRAGDYRKTFIEPLQDPTQRPQEVAKIIMQLEASPEGQGMSKKQLQEEAQAEADRRLATYLKYYEQLLLGEPDRMYGAPPMLGQSLTGPYNVRTIPQP